MTLFVIAIIAILWLVAAVIRWGDDSVTRLHVEQALRREDRDEVTRDDSRAA